jgi:uncharacterized membrane protein
MNKKEFLDLLRQSLEGEVDSNILNQNIRYYNEYISSNSDKSEEDIISEIGDPRLIAKTIIEAQKVSGQEFSGSSKYDNSSNRAYYNENNRDNEYHNSSNKQYTFDGIKPGYKILITIILILVLTLVLKISWVLLKFVMTFFVPIIIIYIVWVMLRKR